MFKKPAKVVTTFLLFLFSQFCWGQAYYNLGLLIPQKSKLAISTSVQTVLASNCSSVVVVQTKNSAGVVTNVASNLTVNLSGTGSTTFYSDPVCTSSITNVTVTGGTSSATFYFATSAVGSPVITASATGYSSISQTETVSTNPFVWTGAGGNVNWATAANWSGGAAPGSTNRAVFDGTCASNCSPTINASASVGGVRIVSGYSGTITQASGKTLTIGSNGWSQAAGTFVGSSTGDAITISGRFSLAGGVFTATSGTTSMGNYWSITGGTFNANAGTLLITNGLTPTINPGSVNYYNVTVTNGGSWTQSFLNGTMNVLGDLIILDSPSYAGNIGTGGSINLTGNYTNNSSNNLWNVDSTINLVGGAASNITISQPTANGGGSGGLNIASAGTVNFSGFVVVSGPFTYTSGTVNIGTSTVSFTGGSSYTIAPGSVQFYNVIMNQSAYNYITLSGTMNISNNLTLASTDGRSSLDGGTIALRGHLTSTSNTNFGTVALQFVGTTTQNITVSSGSSLYSGNITVNNAADITLASAVSWNSSSQTVSVVAGNINMSGFNFTVKSLSLAGRTVKKGGGVLVVNGTTVGVGSLYGGTVTDP